MPSAIPTILLKDKHMVDLVLLPMNIQGKAIMEAMNNKVKKITSKKLLSKNAFYKMWPLEFTHVQIPPHFEVLKVSNVLRVQDLLRGYKEPNV